MAMESLASLSQLSAPCRGQRFQLGAATPVSGRHFGGSWDRQSHFKSQGNRWKGRQLFYSSSKKCVFFLFYDMFEPQTRILQNLIPTLSDELRFKPRLGLIFWGLQPLPDHRATAGAVVGSCPQAPCTWHHHSSGVKSWGYCSVMPPVISIFYRWYDVVFGSHQLGGKHGIVLATWMNPEHIQSYHLVFLERLNSMPSGPRESDLSGAICIFS